MVSLGNSRVIQKVLAVNIKRLRAARGMKKQDDLAELAGISKSAVAQIESCAMWPSPDTLESIAEAVNVPVSRLFSEENAQIPISGNQLVDALKRALDDETAAKMLEHVFAEFLAKD